MFDGFTRETVTTAGGAIHLVRGRAGAPCPPAPPSPPRPGTGSRVAKTRAGPSPRARPCDSVARDAVLPSSDGWINVVTHRRGNTGMITLQLPSPVRYAAVMDVVPAFAVRETNQAGPPQPRLLDRVRDAIRSGHAFPTHLLEAGHAIRTVQATR